MGYVIFMAVVAAIGGILFGYDTAVISGTTEMVRNQFALNDLSEGWYVGCALIGSIAGVLAAGSLSDYIGRKKTMLIAATLFCVCAIGCAVCGSFDSLIAFRIIGGVGIGIVSIVSPMYISEVSPARIRGTLVSLYQLAVTVGFLLAYMANWAIDANIDPTVAGDTLWQKIMHTEAWRGMLGSGTIPSVIFFVIIFFIPESPKWLIVKGCTAKATAVLTKIHGSSAEVENEIAATKASLGEDNGKWSDLLKPGILVAVIAGSAIAILGQFMGVNAVLYYGPKIFTEAGFENPMFSTVLVGIVNYHSHSGLHYRQSGTQAAHLLGSERNDHLPCCHRYLLRMGKQPWTRQRIHAYILPGLCVLHSHFNLRSSIRASFRNVS